MYKDIYDYAKRKNLTSKKNRAIRKVSGYIHLDVNGYFEGVEGIKEKELLCPDKGGLHGNDACNPICEKAGNMFPKLQDYMVKEKEKHKTKYSKCYQAKYGWKWIMEYGSHYDDITAVIYTFVKETDQNEELCAEVIKKLNENKIKLDSYISFKIEGKEVESMSEWEEWFDDYVLKESSDKNGKKKMVISSVTGEKVESVAVKSGPAIKAKQTSNKSSYVVSYDKPSFQSYGFKDNENSSIGQRDAELIKEGAEKLLKSEHNHNNNFKIVYWYDKNVEPDADIIGRTCRRENNNDGEEIKYMNLLNATFSEKSAIPEYKEIKYVITQFDIPGQGRIRFYKAHRGSYGELYENYRKWLGDTTINYSYFSKEKCEQIYSQKRINNLYEILFELLQHDDAKDKFEQIDKEYASGKTEILWSVYENKQIPLMFYRKALTAFVKEIYREKGGKNNLLALSIIKVYLIREKGDDYKMTEVNNQNRDSSYLLGRVLAVVQAAQRASAERNVGVDVTSKYFKLFTTVPSKAFYSIMDKYLVYIKKLNGITEKKGLSIKYEKTMGEILGLLDGKDIPKRFNETEKGEFILGYYFQKQENYKKSLETNTENDFDNIEE